MGYLPEPVAGSLGVDEIAELGQRVFASGPETLQEAADQFELPALSASLLEVLESIVAVVDALPAAAFERQPDDIDGSDVWSAGEIVGHLAAMDLAALPFWESVCGCALPNPPQGLIAAIDRPPAGRHACGEVLQALRAQNERILARASADRDGDVRAMHFALGFANVRAAILGSCVHLVDHHQQLLALEGPSD